MPQSRQVHTAPQRPSMPTSHFSCSTQFPSRQVWADRIPCSSAENEPSMDPGQHKPTALSPERHSQNGLY